LGIYEIKKLNKEKSKMKKLTALILSLALLFAFAVPAMASKTISIVVDGKVIQTDVAPEIKNGRTMVPIRFIAEALGCEVEWEQATQTVKIYHNTQKITVVSTGQKNALKQAKSYLNLMGFSASDLREQLAYHQYTDDEIEYAMANCGGNWKEEYYEKAASYLELMSFSRNDLIDQLRYHNFTDDEITYALEKLNYN
jgi:hypothetical protein